MSLSPAQIAQRLEGISATDVAAIAGVHPFVRPIDVWLQKTGRGRPFDESTRSKWGHLIEPLVRDEYEQLHNVRVEVPGTLQGRRRRWQFATPDGIAYPIGGLEPQNGLEIKVHGRDAIFFGGLQYGAPGTDEVPAHELIQCAWNMDVAELERWDLVAFLDGAPVEFHIDRDEDLLGTLRELAERFLFDHVRTDVQPPADGSKSWDRWLRDRWKKCDREELLSIDTDPELRSKVEQLRATRAELAEAERAEERITQELKDAIGDKGGLSWTEFGRAQRSSIYWRFSKQRVEVDYKVALGAIHTTAALAIDGSMVSWIERLLLRCAEPKPSADGDGVEAGAKTAQLALERVRAMHDALVSIHRGDAINANTKTLPGARPFTVPKHWSKTKTENTEEK